MEAESSPPNAAATGEDGACLCISTRFLQSGDVIGSVQLRPDEKVSKLRCEVADLLGEARPLKLHFEGRRLDARATLVEAGLIDGAVVDIVLGANLCDSGAIGGAAVSGD
eukprot:TRINITY_DN16417_c0_g1_i1.p1 TRINITY_DN16417_c0_g1~~TRINITY_DN16417_c0_g1_i1.p1  ORF type:complete len:110 (+),score=22.95 TRINITY_DN16417_c0_g1_i1:151-480(+)